MEDTVTISLERYKELEKFEMANKSGAILKYSMVYPYYKKIYITEHLKEDEIIQELVISNKCLKEQIDSLKHRTLWQRIFNK